MREEEFMSLLLGDDDISGEEKSYSKILRAAISLGGGNSRCV